VSSGSYSDYRVMCVCPSKKDAKAVAEKYNRDKSSSYDAAEVESLPIVTGDVEKVVTLSLSTTLWDDGRETDQRPADLRVEWPFDAMYGTPDVYWRWVRAPMHGDKGGRLDVRGVDHERVRKVFSEQRAALIADDAYRARREMSR
jgi:hypothetical protein